jgi:pyruvate carboxylase
MALFMVANNLSASDVLDPQRELAFPESVVEMFEGRLGQPPGGWPPALQEKILRGKKPLEGRPGAHLPPADFDVERRKLEAVLGRPAERREVVTSLLYPKVYQDFIAFQSRYSDPSVLSTPMFFYGLVPGEEVQIDIEPGKTLFVKLTGIGEPHPDGTRTVFFELNGQPREVTVRDLSVAVEITRRSKADPNNPMQIGGPMPGVITGVAVEIGDPVAKGQKLASIEAMKMETTLYAEIDGVVDQILIAIGDQVETGDLLFTFRSAPA